MMKFGKGRGDSRVVVSHSSNIPVGMCYTMLNIYNVARIDIVMF